MITRSPALRILNWKWCRWIYVWFLLKYAFNFTFCASSPLTIGSHKGLGTGPHLEFSPEMLSINFGFIRAELCHICADLCWIVPHLCWIVPHLCWIVFHLCWIVLPILRFVLHPSLRYGEQSLHTSPQIRILSWKWCFWIVPDLCWIMLQILDFMLLPSSRYQAAKFRYESALALRILSWKWCRWIVLDLCLIMLPILLFVHRFLYTEWSHLLGI